MKFKTPPSSSSGINVSIDERVRDFIGGAKKEFAPLDVSSGSQKETVVRDGFSMPIEDYQLIDHARRRALSLGLSDIDGVTKSQILRVALRVLDKTNDKDFLALFNQTKALRKRMPGKYC